MELLLVLLIIAALAAIFAPWAGRPRFLPPLLWVVVGFLVLWLVLSLAG